MRAPILPLLTLVLLAACGDKPAAAGSQTANATPPAATPAATPAKPAEKPVSAAPTDAPAAATAPKLDETKYDHFGAGIAADKKATPLADALKDPAQFTGKPVVLEAPIDSVCPSKGCWMKLGAADPKLAVKFKDYGFFVPKDASGRTAIVEGTMTPTEKDGKTTYSFMATGVAITKKVPS